MSPLWSDPAPDTFHSGPVLDLERHGFLFACQLPDNAGRLTLMLADVGHSLAPLVDGRTGRSLGWPWELRCVGVAPEGQVRPIHDLGRLELGNQLQTSQGPATIHELDARHVWSRRLSYDQTQLQYLLSGGTRQVAVWRIRREAELELTLLFPDGP